MILYIQYGILSNSYKSKSVPPTSQLNNYEINRFRYGKGVITSL